MSDALWRELSRVGEDSRPLWRRALEPVLAVLSLPYASVAAFRRRQKTRSRVTLPRPVISIGNITCGGTGKTPTVEMVVRDLLDLGLRPAISSRGYKAASVSTLDGESGTGESGTGESGTGESGTGEPGTGRAGAGEARNDEYEVLAANLPDVPHFTGADRVASGRRAIDAGCDAIVLDDGFQHVRLHRDLDIVLLDATDPFGGGRVLPAGRLRESIDALSAADLIAVTRTELADPDHLDALRRWLARRFPALPEIEMATVSDGWWSLDGTPVSASDLRGGSVVGFCGIGNPAAFRTQLEREGVSLGDWIEFPDHHRYTPADLDGIAERARQVGAIAVVMTQKDAVKASVSGRGAPGETIPWAYVRIRQSISRGGDAYREALHRAVTISPRESG